MRKLLLALLTVFSLSLAGQGTVTTSPPLISNNGQAGITFQLSATSPVDITGISVHLDPVTTGTIDVWMRVGGVTAGGAPTINAANGWTQVITGATAPGAANNVTPLVFSNTISIPANTNIGFYVNTNGGSFVNYQSGTAADQVLYTDGTLTVDVSDALAYGGPLPNPTFNPRRFLGSVTYDLGLGGNCTPPFTNFLIDSIRVDSARVTWTPGSYSNTFKLEYDTAGFTPGTGTVFQASYFGGPPVVYLSNLLPDTDYDVYLTEYCTNDSVYFPSPQTFTTLPVCPAPSNVNIIALDSNSVTFTYTATTDSLSWEWGPRGFLQGTGTSGTSIGDTITVSGLNPNTGYDLLLFSDCTNRGDGSSRASRLSFTTDCGYGVARFTENFDASAFPCLRAYIDVSVGTPSVSITTALSPTSPPQQLLLNNSTAIGAGQDVLLIFQPFYGMNNLNKMVEFNAKTSVTTPTTLEVVSIPNPDNPGVYNVIQSVTLTNSNQRFTINLDANSNYNGTDPVIALRHGAQASSQAIYIDDFVFDRIPTCPPINPFSVVTDAVGTDVYLSWVSNSTAVGANVTWGNPGFTPGSGLGMQGTSTNASTISGLSPNTIYDFYIQDSCGTNDVAVWVGPFSVLTGCGPLSPAALPLLDGFELYSTGPSFNGTNNLCSPSHSWRFAASDETASRLRLQSGATFYKNGLQAATLDHSPSAPAVQSNFMTLSVNLSNYTSAGGIELGFYVMSHGQEANPDNRVWVRGAPSDPWIEAVDLDALRSAQGVYDSVQNLDIKGLIDAAGQSIGAATQIRFGQSGRFAASSITFSDGITIDDLSLEVVNCPVPAGLNVSNLFDTTATFSWASPASQFQFWIGPGGFFQGSTTIGGTKFFTSSNSIVLDTLNPQTCYQVLVRAACGAGDTSDWAGPFDLCTPCSPISAPSLETWDNLAIGKDLGCFSAIQDPTHLASNFLGASTTSSGTPFSSPRQIEMDNSSSTHPLMIVSPPTTDMTAGDKRVVVRARQLSAYVPPAVMVIGTMSNPFDANTFHPLDTFELSELLPADRYITEITAANGYNGTDAYFAIAHGKRTTFRTFYIDDVLYEQIPSCPEVSNLRVLAVDSMNATIAFDPAVGSTGNFQVEYGSGSQGSPLNSFTIVTNDTASLSGLSSNTNYCFWVREICTPGDTSNWTGPMCFKTQCLSITAPYFENWDNLSQGNDVGCFNKIEDPALVSSVFLGVTIQNSSTYLPVSVPNTVEFDNSSFTSSPLMLISPLTRDMRAGDKRIRFFARSTSTATPRSLIAGTMSNPLDANTFTPLDTFMMTLNMVEYISEITTANGYNGTDDYFVIAHGQMATFQYIYLDDLNYEVIPTCVRPNGLVSSGVTQNGATLSWTNANGNSSPNYEIEYGNAPLGDPSNTRAIHTSNSITLSGLTAGTGYCFWIREICTVGDTSLWQGPECFATPCPTSYSAPYFTNFEGITIGVASGTPAGWENCWTHNTVTGSVRWESEDATGGNENSTGTGPFYDNTLAPNPGGTYMYLETSTSGGPAELTSPGVDISTVANPELEYHYHMFGATINKLVIYAENASGTRTAIDSLVGQQQNAQADPFMRRNVPLGSLPGGVYKFVFEGHRGTSFTGDISIDDVAVQQGSSCPKPLGISGDPLTTTSAIARWSGTAQATGYQVEYGPTGFSQGNGTLVITSVDSIALTFAAANNLCQDVYVRAICPSGDTSAWIGPAAVCPEEVTCDNLDQYDVSLKVYDQSALFVPWAGNAGDVTMSTSQASSAPNSVRIYDAGSSGFSDLVALFDTLSSGAWEVAFDLYIPTGKGAYFNVQQNYIGGAAGNLWGGEIYFLDNGNADVVYTTGSVLAGSFSYSQGSWFTMQTVIDLDNDTIWFEINGVSTGVGYQYSLANAAGPIQFNGINFYSGVRQGFTYGCDYYFDDFCISPRATTAPCPAPTALAATANVACDSIELDWTSNSGSSLLEYGPAGFTPGSGTFVTVSSTPYTVGGLVPGTSYDFRVADLCGTDTSNFASTNETTASGPLPSASFTLSQTTTGNTTEVRLDASASTNGTSFAWDFGNGVAGSGMMDTTVYIGNGVYTILLTVSNACGTDTMSRTISVGQGSIGESILAQTINAYPNPSSGFFWVEATLEGSEAVAISLLDAQGRKVLSLSEASHNGSLKREIDVSELAAGIYMLELRQGSATATRRIIIE